MLDTKDYYVKFKINAIILNIIKAGLTGLKEGQQHPYLQILTNNGIVTQLFGTIDFDNILKQTALFLSYLYKATPIPTEYRRKIIKILKSLNIEYYDSLAMLAECPENHDTILEDNFYEWVFQYEYFPLPYLHITLLILKLGSGTNKNKVANSVIDKVKKYSDDKYMDQSSYWCNRSQSKRFDLISTIWAKKVNFFPSFANQFRFKPRQYTYFMIWMKTYVYEQKEDDEEEEDDYEEEEEDDYEEEEDDDDDEDEDDDDDEEDDDDDEDEDDDDEEDDDDDEEEDDCYQCPLEEQKNY
ncbi:MAG: hypothetical protein EZS28_021554 [Streblomastix strix]|uniref:Uncharacterized protein n=1 Tax=Streblomastix strix TaxID=222440 RepID=A0A5J4VJZ2_9EUKA|nr:MAG: hypothetical protein EZS28_021554 [Streblomastix strix]